MATMRLNWGSSSRRDISFPINIGLILAGCEDGLDWTGLDISGLRRWTGLERWTRLMLQRQASNCNISTASKMLSLGKYTIGQQCNAVIFQKPFSETVLFQARNHQTKLACLNSAKTLAHLGLFGVLGEKRNGLCLFASNSQRKSVDSVLEVEDLDEDDDFFEENEGGFTEEDDDDEDDEFIPMLEMKQWLKNKPRGFGEGKVYDTSIEDKLMEEIEQSRKAQLVNINNLKKIHGRSISKKDQSQQEKGKSAVPEVGQQGFRVRLVNLPKKRNIHKDLDLAFKGVPGILQIVPVVSGNKKTRDPICKGLAFIDFKSETEAHRFVQTFSGQSITFGKVQKQINCDMDISSLKSGNEHAAQPALASLDYLAGTDSTRFGSEGEVHKSTQMVDDEELLEHNQNLALPESIYVDDPVEREKGTIIKSSSSKQKRKPLEKGGEAPAKMKKEKIPKTTIPGSANRLKIREKAILAGVFSKYVASIPSAKVRKAD